MNISGFHSGLRTALWNIRSACNKMSLLAQLFSDEELDLMMVVETWQCPSVPGKLDAFSADLKDHFLFENAPVKIICEPRTNGRCGGGLALVYRSNLSLSAYKLGIPKPSTFEFLSCKLKAERCFLLICLYRLQSTSFASFLSEFRQFLVTLSSQPVEAIVAGDFNIWINADEDSNSISFNTLLFEHDMTAVTSQTATHNLGNTLDFLVIPTSLTSCISPVFADSTVAGSDHFPCLFSINTHAVTVNRQLQSSGLCRSFRSIDHDALSSALHSNLHPLLTSDSSDFPEYLFQYRLKVTEVLNSVAPLRPRHQNNTYVRPPWMDTEYVRQRAIRKRLQRQGDKSAYNAQKRHCQYLSRIKQISYNKSVIDDAVSTNDQRQVYKAVNKLLDRSKETRVLPFHTNASILGNSLNEFFVQKPSTIRDTILVPVSNNSLPQQPTSVPSADLPRSEAHGWLNTYDPTSAEELSMLIKHHGVKVGPGDVLTPRIIKAHLPVLLPHFVKLVNLSLSTCSTEGLKEAHVVPILKSLNLDQDNFKNYRPVSLLSFISKLTERVVHERINEHLTANSLHSTSQYGYKKNHSVETLMLKLVDDILIAVDKKFGVVMLIVDLSAAFDTVDHLLLMRILQDRYKIGGSALSWIQSFLTGRCQRVKIGGTLSDSLAVLFGVPQGSILGPLLFNMYCSTINDAFCSSGFDSMGYADDNFGARIFTARTKLTTLSTAVPDCLTSIKQWTDAHFLKLNMDKTEVVVFGSRHFLSSLNFSTVRTNDGLLLPISRSTKMLGIYLDSCLSFDTQVSHVCSSVNIALKNIRKIRKSLDQATAETIVHSLITNKLDQCNALYVGCSKSNLAKLQFLQNSALRLVLQLPSHSPITSHMESLHWLSIEKRCYYKFLVMVFKCLFGLAPTGLAAKIKIASPLNMLLDTSVFAPCSALGRRAFSYLGPRCWNALPRELRVLPSLSTFQANLKHYFFERFNEFIRRCDPYTTERISSSQPSHLFSRWDTAFYFISN